MKPTFSTIDTKDFAPIAKIIAKQWNYLEQCNNDETCAFELAKSYLFNTLAYSSYNCTAIYDNEIAGIIMARANCIYKENEQYIHLMDKQNKICKELSNCQEAIEFYKNLDNIYQHMLKSSTYEFDSEIVFFIVDHKYQGLGIGSGLLEQALKYLKQAQCKHCYVYTDVWCNYKFYLNKGFNMHQEYKLESNDEKIFMFDIKI